VANSQKPRAIARRLGRCGTALGLLALLAWSSAPAAAEAACNRISVETRDGRVLLSSYVVSEPDYVAKLRRQIEQNGEDGSWTVAAGELGSVGYTVTYSCQA
jgi:hypothetical protein